jgi:hypothetical protein
MFPEVIKYTMLERVVKTARRFRLKMKFFHLLIFPESTWFPHVYFCHLSVSSVQIFAINARTKCCPGKYLQKMPDYLLEAKEGLKPFV